MWFFGIVSSVFYCIVFFDAKLYADMSINIYYVVVSIYGWINWSKNTGSSTTAIATLNKKLLIQLCIATALVYLIYFVVLNHFTDSSVPKTDALVGALSIIGTWMLAKKLIENWLVWIAVDAICIGLYLYKGLYPTVLLFVIYTAMAVVGYWQWKKNICNQTHN